MQKMNQIHPLNVDMFGRRCVTCEKKLPLVDATVGLCKCGNTYCSRHRLPEHHDCTFDHREKALQQLKKRLDERVVSKKVETI